MVATVDSTLVDEHLARIDRFVLGVQSLSARLTAMLDRLDPAPQTDQTSDYVAPVQPQTVSKAPVTADDINMDDLLNGINFADIGIDL